MPDGPDDITPPAVTEKLALRLTPGPAERLDGRVHLAAGRAAGSSA